MKLTPEGKKVWDYQTTVGQVPKVDPGQWAYSAPGIPFGWTVAREALGGICGNSKLYITGDLNKIEVSGMAVDCAIALCNKLAEVESEGS